MWALESELRHPHLPPLAPHRVHRPPELQRDLLVAGRAEQLQLLRRPDPPARVQWRPSAEALGRGRDRIPFLIRPAPRLERLITRPACQMRKPRIHV